MAEIHDKAQSLLNESILMIAKNVELMKLLVHDRVDINPAELGLVSKPQQYIFQPEQIYTPENNNFRLYQHCYIPEVLENKRSLICCEVDNVKPIKNNVVHGYYYVTFYVSTHIDLKVIKGGIRRDLAMCSLINSMFNRYTFDSSIKDCVHKGSTLFSYNSKWQGYRMSYELMASNCIN
jgi:hypothetical protein